MPSPTLLLKLLLSGILFSIAFADFRTRSIAVWQLVVAIVGFALWGAFRHSLVEVVRYSAMNFALLLVQFAILWGWLAIRERKLAGFMGKYIGLGDILFMLAFILFMPFEWFVLFFASSMIATLFFAVLAKTVSPRQFDTIPLAGCLAVCAVAYLALEGYLPESLF